MGTWDEKHSAFASATMLFRSCGRLIRNKEKG